MRLKTIRHIAMAMLVAAGTLIVSGGASGQVGLSSRVVLQTMTTAIGQSIEYPLMRGQWTGVAFEIAPGGEAGRHRHPVPNFVYVIEGQLTIEVEGQAPRTYSAGQAFAESMNTWHNAFNRGAAPVKALAVFAGTEGTPPTIRP